MDSPNTVTLKSLVKSKALQHNYWYWYDAPILKGYSAPLDSTNKDNPLLMRKDSPLIDIKSYASKALHTQWDGMAFIQNEHGNNLVSSKIILLHRKYEVTESLKSRIINQINKFNVENEGIYYFKEHLEHPEVLQEVFPDDLPFLRSYYAITVKAQHVDITMLKATVSQYTLYDYYPNGRVRTIVILNAFWDRDSILKNVYINEYSFADKPRFPVFIAAAKSLHQTGESKTKITDPNHYYWLDKLLRN